MATKALDAIPDLVRKQLLKAQRQNIRVVEDSTEWFILFDTESYQLSMTHRPSLSYSKTTFKTGRPPEFKLYDGHHHRVIFTREWWYTHTTKMFSLTESVLNPPPIA
jgi:hypothetical protein